MRWIHLTSAIVAAFLLVACSPTSVLNTVVPSGSYTLVEDMPYADAERQRMDLYLPNTDEIKPQVVMFIYGGSWEEGDKQDFSFIGQAFARLGYVTVIPNYRLYPEVEFPAFIVDVAKAIAELPASLQQDTVRQHLSFDAQHCISGQQIILAGHSAGAHTAALLATDLTYLNEQGVDAEVLTALIGLAGPYDLPLEHERVEDKFTRVEGDEANPIALAHERVPPTLLIHGESDTVAKPEHAERFAERLRQLGVEVTLHTYPRRRHVDLVASLASPLRFWTPAYSDIQDFLTAQGLTQKC